MRCATWCGKKWKLAPLGIGTSLIYPLRFTPKTEELIAVMQGRRPKYQGKYISAHAQ